MKAFDSATLERLYRSISLAQQSGALRSHHGPLETTAWVYIAIADLERWPDNVRRSLAVVHVHIRWVCRILCA
jgi:hypothetical protein